MINTAMKEKDLQEVEKIALDTDKLYYGFPIFLLGYKDEAYGYNYTTNSSSYTLGDMLVVGIYKYGNGIQQIRAAGCFTLNVPTEKLMGEIEIGGLYSGDDKFKLAQKLTWTRSKKVDAPLINECVLNIECEVIKVVELDAFDGYCNIIAKIKGRFVNRELQENGRLKNDLLKPVFYLGDGHKRSYRYLNDDLNDFGDFSREKE